MDASDGEHCVALVSLAFLQAGCGNAECQKELLSLGRELNMDRDIKSNGVLHEFKDDGELETDGHSPPNISVWLGDLQPSAGFQRPGALLLTLSVPLNCI